MKYDILRHPNVKFTEDGGAEPYIHGAVEQDVTNIVIIGMRELKKDEKQDGDVPEDTGYELLSDEDLLEEIAKEEKKHDEEKNGKES